MKFPSRNTGGSFIRANLFDRDVGIPYATTHSNGRKIERKGSFLSITRAREQGEEEEWLIGGVNGVLRVGEAKPTAPGSPFAYELYAFKGNAEVAYRPTSDLYVNPTQQDVKTVWPWCWSSRYSGPLALWAQYARGNLRGYQDALTKMGVPFETAPVVGDAVVLVAGKPFALRVVATAYGDVELQAAPVPVMSASLFEAPPDELVDLFGGVPVPHINWGQAYTCCTSEQYIEATATVNGQTAAHGATLGIGGCKDTLGFQEQAFCRLPGNAAGSELSVVFHRTNASVALLVRYTFEMAPVEVGGKLVMRLRAKPALVKYAASGTGIRILQLWAKVYDNYILGVATGMGLLEANQSTKKPALLAVTYSGGKAVTIEESRGPWVLGSVEASGGAGYRWRRQIVRLGNTGTAEVMVTSNSGETSAGTTSGSYASRDKKAYTALGAWPSNPDFTLYRLKWERWATGSGKSELTYSYPARKDLGEVILLARDGVYLIGRAACTAYARSTTTNYALDLYKTEQSEIPFPNTAPPVNSDVTTPRGEDYRAAAIDAGWTGEDWRTHSESSSETKAVLSYGQPVLKAGGVQLNVARRMDDNGSATDWTAVKAVGTYLYNVSTSALGGQQVIARMDSLSGPATFTAGSLVETTEDRAYTINDDVFFVGRTQE